ncbi:MAG: hypothetical protein L3K24_12375 [Gammaproteobacteria bacterium]|nr:hypothetical protein [Gammaproteobacteria bacterium]
MYLNNGKPGFDSRPSPEKSKHVIINFRILPLALMLSATLSLASTQTKADAAAQHERGEKLSDENIDDLVHFIKKAPKKYARTIAP